MMYHGQNGMGDLFPAVFPELASPVAPTVVMTVTPSGMPGLCLTPSPPMHSSGMNMGVSGLGFDFSGTGLDSIDWKKWAIIGAGLLIAYWLISRPSGYRSARREAIERVKKQYPRGYTRAKRAAKEGYEYGARTGKILGF